MKYSIESLPEEILEKIFFNLSPYKEYDSVASVCKQWRRVIKGVASQVKKNFESAIDEQSVTWTEVCIDGKSSSFDTSLMSPRLFHSACYSDISRAVYVFGGRSVGSQSAGFNDLWRLNMHTKRWERPIIHGNFPQPKFGCSLESHQNHLILYGGRSMPRSTPFVLYQSDCCSDELHVFDTETSKWELKQSLQDSPPALYLHGTCIVTNQSDDGDGCMVLFGGIKERGAVDNPEIWCLDLATYGWWKPTVIGHLPEARHMHTQAAVKSEYTFSSAVLIVGGCTTENRIITDAWLLIRSGFREWTTTSLVIQPGPENFLPAMSIFKKGGIRIGTNLVFFAGTPPDKIVPKRKIVQSYPYENEDESAGMKRIFSTRDYLNPLCMYVLDLSAVISENIVTWKTPFTKDGISIRPNVTGPNRPNYHVALVARGEIVVHGDFAIETPQVIERVIRQSHNFLLNRNANKWTPLYFISSNLS